MTPTARTTDTDAASGQEAAPLRWDPPGKGDWRGLHDHFPRALTPEYQRLLAQGMTEGEAEHFALYGLPARTIEPAFVHGRVFISAAPLVGPRSNRVPPAWAMWLAVRLVPVFRRRGRAAARAVAERRWLAEAERWFGVDRPAWLARNAELDAVDPAGLDDDGLVAHLRAVRANAASGYRDHFRLHGTDLLPTGMFLARAIDWGIDPHAAADLLAGSSPASRGDGTLPRWRLVTGYDLDDRCAAELPDVPTPAGGPGGARGAGRSGGARGAGRSGVAPGGGEAAGKSAPGPGASAAALAVSASPGPTVDVDHRAEDALRARVPAADRDEWDQLLTDARATYGVRDDNGLLTAAWPVGLLRRAMLEAGRRLAERSALQDPEHAVELTVDELVATVASPVAGSAAGSTAAPRSAASDGVAPVCADEAAARRAQRDRLTAAVPPASLGPAQDLPVDAMPAAMRTITRALLTTRDLGTSELGERPPLSGVGIGTDVVQGRALVTLDPAEAFARFEPGDVVITRGTCPAWNAVLAAAGGVVTEEGGPLSHAAVIARELGLPAVVGAADAATRVPDGATVELDPAAGTIRIIDRG